MKTIAQKLWMFTAMLLVSLSAVAYDFKVDGIYYYVKTSHEVVVTSKTQLQPYDSYSGVINLPSTVTYNGTNYTVTGIGK